MNTYMKALMRARQTDENGRAIQVRPTYNYYVDLETGEQLDSKKWITTHIYNYNKLFTKTKLYDNTVTQHIEHYVFLWPQNNTNERY